jgi:crossover junction endodeoxyribonuclease RusA
VLLMGGSWELVVLAPDGRCWGVNDDHRANRYAVARHRKQVRADAFWQAKAEKVPALERIRLDVDVYIARPNAADPPNYASGSTVKGAVDGLVDAGVVPNDTGRHVDMRMPRMRAKGPGGLARIVLTITPWVVEGEGAA